MGLSFKHSTYTTHRIRPLRAYVERMTTYLHLHYPNKSKDQIRAFVERKTKERFVPAKADVLYHPIPGKTERKTVNLLTHLHDQMAQNIITPSGSTYVLPTVRESFLKTTLADKKAKRGIYKKDIKMDDGFIINEDGNVCESISSNVFIVKNGALYTPALAEGCIEGVLRKQIIDIAKENRILCYEIALAFNTLMNADEIFLTNSVYNIRWVKNIADKIFTNNRVQKIYASFPPTIL